MKERNKLPRSRTKHEAVFLRVRFIKILILNAIMPSLLCLRSVKAWGPKPFTDYVWERSMDIYYDDIEDDDGSSNDDVPVSEPGYADMRLGDQGTGHSRRYTTRNESKMRTAPFTVGQ